MDKTIGVISEKPTLRDLMEAEKKKMYDRIFQAIDFAVTDFREKTGLEVETVKPFLMDKQVDGKIIRSMCTLEIETQKTPR